MSYVTLVAINNRFLREGWVYMRFNVFMRSPFINGDNSSPPILSLANIIVDFSFKCLNPRRKDDIASLVTVAGRSLIRIFMIVWICL